MIQGGVPRCLRTGRVGGREVVCLTTDEGGRGVGGRGGGGS